MSKSKVTQSVSEWVSQWQGHLLSCSGQLKNLTLRWSLRYFWEIAAAFPCSCSHFHPAPTWPNKSQQGAHSSAFLKYSYTAFQFKVLKLKEQLLLPDIQYVCKLRQNLNYFGTLRHICPNTYVPMAHVPFRRNRNLLDSTTAKLPQLLPLCNLY